MNLGHQTDWLGSLLADDRLEGLLRELGCISQHEGQVVKDVGRQQLWVTSAGRKSSPSRARCRTANTTGPTQTTTPMTNTSPTASLQGERRLGPEIILSVFQKFAQGSRRPRKQAIAREHNSTAPVQRKCRRKECRSQLESFQHFFSSSQIDSIPQSV